MKRLFIYICFVFLSQSLLAQKKIVVGSDIPTIKNMKDNIVWLNGMPEMDKFQIIDFYQPVNKSCVSNITRLLDIKKIYGDILNIIVLTKESDQRIHNLAKSMEGKLYVGIDTTDNGYFSKCYVKYLPYTVFVDQRNKLIWHGFLCSLSNEMIDEKVNNVQ